MIFVLAIAAFFLRIVLSPFGTLSLDHNTFVAWSQNIAAYGFAHFYDGWSDYLPGYIYVLWFLGNIRIVFPAIATHILYKLPAIVADIATGIIIYKVLLQYKNKRQALIFSCLYLFNPAIFANSSLWGQVDSLTAMFSILCIYLLSANPFLSAVSLAIGTAVKPQAALALIVVLAHAYFGKWKLPKVLRYMVVGALTFGLLFLPFTNIGNLPKFIFERLSVTLSQYPYTSVNAFNFWGLGGFWKPDTWQGGAGAILTVISGIFVIWKLRAKQYRDWAALSVLFLSGFLFMTRMHERHLLPTFAPMIIMSAFVPALIYCYLALSLSYIANLYFAFVWITENFKNVFTTLQINLLTFLSLVAYFVFGATVVFGKKLVINIKQSQERLFKDRINEKTAKILLVGILIFAFISRIFALSFPNKEYFDEVYHAFTAKVLLHNDPKAWEWGNPNPEGYAYEWTHPPLAKEMMWVGMKVLGENSMGWRIPAAIFGTLCVFMIYKLSFLFFKNREIALISSAFFALEGLALVMSRIGMNDIYLLFFILLSLFLFIKDKYLLSSIALGLAASSKWSTLWFLPVLIVCFFVFKKKFSFKYLYFLVVPPLVYLACYIPFFTSGHSWNQFVELQQQMWWYHTKLVATHSYSSPWWSWPLNLRPVWMFVDRSVPGKVSNIYALGNPLLIWMGVVCMIACLYWAVSERNKKLGAIIFAYLVFFVSWAMSPRIMFFYHFLPSTPFLVIAMGYVAKRAKLIVPMIAVSLLVFVYFYPQWTGLAVPLNLSNSYYWLDSWR